MVDAIFGNQLCVEHRYHYICTGSGSGLYKNVHKMKFLKLPLLVYYTSDSVEFCNNLILIILRQYE